MYKFIVIIICFQMSIFAQTKQDSLKIYQEKAKIDSLYEIANLFNSSSSIQEKESANIIQCKADSMYKQWKLSCSIVGINAGYIE